MATDKQRTVGGKAGDMATGKQRTVGGKAGDIKVYILTEVNA